MEMNKKDAIRLIGIHLNNVYLTEKDQLAWDFIIEKLNSHPDLQEKDDNEFPKKTKDDNEFPKKTNVVIPEDEFKTLLGKIDLLIQHPNNTAAKTFARTSLETLKAYMPSEILKYYLSQQNDIKTKP